MKQILMHNTDESKKTGEYKSKGRGKLMRQIAALIMALVLCIIALPAIGGAAELGDGDNIWIAISPTESHPALVDRPAAVLPSIGSYRIRVAVYSNPYAGVNYNDADGDGELDDDEIFNVASLESDTARLSIPGSASVASVTVHKESDEKHTYIFMVRDFKGALTSDVTKLVFTAEDGTYQGSGAVKIIDAAKGSGSGGSGGNGGSGGRGGK
ncbi:hypothetical protein EO98_19520 [Methanosarcina sp. 2.H.T.1A.6]|uniref:hypothetical protein n=1 Tax=unclassified Methanosarcina TaxID=2644672 RepID=UPI00062184CD|nr:MULTISPECIES: hypothetical protein [unclassified Methanosarcina]KKG16964.1 hypothetical protein EO97_05420 [Methanosarcina sp. 2.H.T.1A.15]KKG19439.1 hypothetical protein EO98_19520 [Methanosarcina sp. 2.H.T.1A.6]KKG27489.1 hypothetical protein EO96_10895 [Methanosarcina sp. 2.H.T.1A.8]